MTFNSKLLHGKIKTAHKWGDLTMQEFFVVKVVKDGKTLFANGSTIFDENPLVSEPWEARRFTRLDDYSLGSLLQGFWTKDQTSRARSGLCVDAKPEIVRIRCSYEIVDTLQLSDLKV